MVVPVHPAGGCGFKGSSRPFQGPSRQNGPRACRGLAPTRRRARSSRRRAPRLQGACPGPGRRRLRREEPTASAEATGALVDESPGVGDGQVTWIRGRCGGPGPRDHRRRGACAPRVACSRAPAAPWCPVRVLVAPADDAAVAHRPRDEGGATRNPVPGRHVGEVDHPAPVRTGRRRESRRARAERGPGSPWRARWCAPSGPARRRSVPVPACAAPRCTGPPGGPLAGSPAAARSSWIPAPASKRLLSQGEDPLVQGGVRDRPLRRRAGPGGVSQVDGAGPATLTRSGRCRSAQAPQLLPCARRCSRRSAGRALTLRRHDKPTRSSGSRPPAPGSRTSFSNSPVRRASPVVVPGRSPASIRA